MKFKEFVQAMVDYLEKNPEHGELDTVYCSDDEGNACYELHRDKPTPGIFDGEYGGTLLTYKEDIKEAQEDAKFTGKEVKINAICVN